MSGKEPKKPKKPKEDSSFLSKKENKAAINFAIEVVNISS